MARDGGAGSDGWTRGRSGDPWARGRWLGASAWHGEDADGDDVLQLTLEQRGVEEVVVRAGDLRGAAPLLHKQIEGGL